MFFKIIFLKKFANFTGKHLSRSLSNKVAGPHNCNVIKKKLQHKFFPVNFVNYSRPPILWRIYERLVLKHQCNFLKTSFLQNTFFTSPVAVSAVLGCLAVSDGFRFLSCNFIKKETRAKVFICEFCFKNIFWQNTSRWLLSCVYLKILRSI